MSDTDSDFKVTIETSTLQSENTTEKPAEVEQLQIDLHLSDSDSDSRPQLLLWSAGKG